MIGLTVKIGTGKSDFVSIEHWQAASGPDLKLEDAQVTKLKVVFLGRENPKIVQALKDLAAAMQEEGGVADDHRPEPVIGHDPTIVSGNPTQTYDSNLFSPNGYC